MMPICLLRYGNVSFLLALEEDKVALAGEQAPHYHSAILTALLFLELICDDIFFYKHSQQKK